MREVIMPKLGLSMTAGTIAKWHKKEGDGVREGELLLEVMTDKTVIEVEAYHSGTILKILKEEGAEVPVTEVIAYIGEPGEKIVPAPAPPPAEAARWSGQPEGTAAPAPEKGAGDAAVRITPIARRLAREKGVDIRSLKGTGPDGRIVREDVERAAAAGPGSAGAEARGCAAAPQTAARVKSSRPLAGIRKVIAERLTRSAQTIPHVVVEIVLDAGPLVEARQRLLDRSGGPADARPTITDFLIKAAATVLAEQPAINSSLIDNRHILYEDVNVGLAVDTAAGLIVPTIYSADRLSIVEIARKRKELIEKGKQSRYALDEVSNGTFTISNLGMFGVRSFTAIINPPQSAILIVGEIYKAPVVEQDRIGVGTLMQVSLAVDHRIIDGADAARFLSRLREMLQRPELLIPDGPAEA